MCSLLQEVNITSTSASDESAIPDYDDFRTIERVSSANLTYDAFFHDYMLANRAVIITGIPDSWDCYHNWRNDDDNNLIINTDDDDDVATSSPPTNSCLNIDYLSAKMRTLRTDSVPVADCDRSQFDAHCKFEMPFGEYVAYWKSASHNAAERLLYLKDWHLRQTMPEYEFYKTPAYFASDWLNESLVTAGEDDYRFVYIGPAGTWTPFHADVFGSFSWSTNVAGRKEWLLLPPGEEQKLTNRYGQLPFSVQLADLVAQNVRHFVVEQDAGETVFVPSGWYHQVRNVEAAVSVNHNWFNGCNVWHVWQMLRKTYALVRNEIADCADMDDFDGHCELMLRADYGMNVAGFVELLRRVAERRLHDGGGAAFDGFVFGPQHCSFDLRQIRRVLRDVDDAMGERYAAIRERCSALLVRIEAALELCD